MKNKIILVLVLLLGFLGGYYFRDFRDREQNQKIDAYINSLDLDN